jgi:hypothetical protein
VAVAAGPQAGHRRAKSDGSALLDWARQATPAAEAFLTEAKPKNRPLRLPQDSAGWTPFEVDMFFLSEGEYNPAKMAQRRRISRLAGATGQTAGTGATQEVAGRVSIVSPTMSSRQHFHEQLWACFEAQDWEDKELIVVETYTHTPSAFLQQKAEEDSRLIHVAIQRPASRDFSVGLKRNMTLHLASGSTVVNFDDDDIYAANYVSSMVNEMSARGLAALTLSSWFNYIVPRMVSAYSDPESKLQDDPEELEEVLYGYGFSYVHRRGISLIFPYPDVEFAEDAPFLLKLKEVLGDSKVGLKRDTTGICMHIVHRANSTGTDGESISREVTQEELDALSVSKLPVFQEFLNMHATSWWQLLPFATLRLGFLTPSLAESSASRLSRHACL